MLTGFSLAFLWGDEIIDDRKAKTLHAAWYGYNLCIIYRNLTWYLSTYCFRTHAVAFPTDATQFLQYKSLYCDVTNIVWAPM